MVYIMIYVMIYIKKDNYTTSLPSTWTCCRSKILMPVNGCFNAAGPDSPLYRLPLVEDPCLIEIHLTALKWKMQQCRFGFTAEGCDRLHQLSVEDSGALGTLEVQYARQNRAVLQVENRKGRQHSGGLCCGPFQVHDIYYRCMIYTILYTIVYIIVYTMIYTMIYIMVYTMIYIHVYALLIYTVTSGARSHPVLTSPH
jgi:hypothetical protein